MLRKRERLPLQPRAWAGPSGAWRAEEAAACGTGGRWRTRSSGLGQQGRPCRTSGPPTTFRHAAPSRASLHGFRVQAQTNHTPPLLLGLNL